MPSFCPIYARAREKATQFTSERLSQSAHRGLVFNKFANAWKYNANQVPEFDKGDGNSNPGGIWLRSMAATPCGDPSLLEEACKRQQSLTHAMGGRTLLLTNKDSRFVTGLGCDHPLENGFAWHPTLGTPYLPASGLKGLLRTWLREEEGELKTGGKGVCWKESERIKGCFGLQDQAGRFILLDMLPTRPTSLCVEVMTPHYGPYYRGEAAPGDWHSPVPIPFLVVEKGAQWQVGILPGPGHRSVDAAEMDHLVDDLVKALAFLGGGAKTADGLGIFVRDERAELMLQRSLEQEQAKREAQQTLVKALNDLPQELHELAQKAAQERWSEHQTPFLDGAEQYLDRCEKPTRECIEWIRDEFLEKHWKGVWNDPDAMKGKKKDKYKFTSKRARDLTHRLKELYQQ